MYQLNGKKDMISSYKHERNQQARKEANLSTRGDIEEHAYDQDPPWVEGMPLLKKMVARRWRLPDTIGWDSSISVRFLLCGRQLGDRLLSHPPALLQLLPTPLLFFFTIKILINTIYLLLLGPLFVVGASRWNAFAGGP